MAEPRFLSVDDVVVLHAIAIENQGGTPTIRDRAMRNPPLLSRRSSSEGLISIRTLSRWPRHTRFTFA